MQKKMLNFTVGPVQSSEMIRNIGAEQVPYFRTTEFSEMMFENETLIKKLSKAPENSKVVFITASGTASMEATIMNTLTTEDKAIIVNGGSFGQRFVELCNIYKIPYSEIKLETGRNLEIEDLKGYENQGYTAFIVNAHETSTGVHYDMDKISKFCKRNHLFLIVDAISSFLADPFDMKALNVDVMITGSQKALACPPGISIIVLSENAVNRVYQNNPKCLYLNLKVALENEKRGQTPFTPAVSIIRQIHARLKEIDQNGGVEFESKKIHDLAIDFRTRIKDLPVEFITNSPSNAVTALHPLNVSAYDIFVELKDYYHIWICPNGGMLKDKIFRVGHIGDLTKKDNTILINAFQDMKKRGKL